MGFTIAIRDRTFQENEIKEQLLSVPDNELLSWESEIISFLRDWYNNHDTIELKTSGSTGNPSVVKVRKRNMVESARRTLDFFGLQPGDTALLCLPAGFIAGKMMIVRAVTGHLTLITTEPTGNPMESASGSFDFAAMIPLQVHNILNDENGVARLNSIKNLIIGGGTIDSALRKSISGLTNKVYETYGMTETLTHVALKKLNVPGKQKHFKAMSGITFHQENNGCLSILAPYISSEKIITNDIVVLHNSAEFNYVGRLDNVINSGGLKISPEEIEDRIRPHIPWKFIIAGLPDAKLGEKVVLIIERQSLQREETPQIPEGLLNTYEKPREIITIKSFERTASGKVIRNSVIAEAMKTIRTV